MRMWRPFVEESDTVNDISYTNTLRQMCQCKKAEDQKSLTGPYTGCPKLYSLRQLLLVIFFAIEDRLPVPEI